MSAEDVEVNLLGSLRMTRLALPQLQASGSGAVVYISSAVALCRSRLLGTKAAVHSLARSLREELKSSGIRVFEVLPPVVDTGPVRGLDVPKVSAAAVADAIVDGLERDREEIRIGRVRQLAVLARVMPSVADRLVMRAFTPRPGA
jgi:uncharacterized oxidoreductase